jgi:flavin-binding protein dodecin
MNQIADGPPQRIGRRPLVSPPNMTDHVYKSVEITGSSETGVQEAIDGALTKAGKTLRNIDWFEVVGIRGGFADGKTYYQVTLKIGFRLED